MQTPAVSTGGPDAYVRALGDVVEVHDGDTFTASVDLGYHTLARSVIFRIARVNSPEMGRKDGPTRKAADAARVYTQDWLIEHRAHAGLFVRSTATDNWQRYLAEVFCGQDHNLSDGLLASGNAVLYVR